MAFDEALADRVRDVLASRGDLSERRMFGGIAFMLGGNMAVGVIGEDLMVRLDPGDAEEAPREPYTRPMDFTGRPRKNMAYADPTRPEADEDLAARANAGADFT